MQQVVQNIRNGKLSIVDANRVGFLTTGGVAGVCLTIPRSTPTCVDVGRVRASTGYRFYYQALGICADNSEGPP